MDDFDLKESFSDMIAKEIVKEVDNLIINTLMQNLVANISHIPFNMECIEKIFIDEKMFVLDFIQNISKLGKEYSIILRAYDRELKITSSEIKLGQVEDDFAKTFRTVTWKYEIDRGNDSYHYIQTFNALMRAIEDVLMDSLENIFGNKVSYIVT